MKKWITGRKDKSYDLIIEKMQLINFSNVRKLEYAHLKGQNHDGGPKIDTL